jgi:putative endonuclease
MTDPRHPFGQQNEALAAAYLQAQGYRILTTNWRCKHGEIDIVAQHNTTVVFVEVRSRHAANTESAFESITPHKRAKLAATAQAYLSAHRMEHINWRIDVIAVAIPKSGKPIIEQIEDALGW